jgi:hypothetical protein
MSLISNDIPASFNGNQPHESARPGLSIPSVTTRQTETAIGTSSLSSPTSPHDATSTIYCKICKVPGIVASFASFLLDQTTTRHVEDSKTHSSMISHSHTTKSSRTLGPVQSDPFRSTSDPIAARQPSSREETDGTQLTTTKSEVGIPHALSEVEPSHTSDSSSPAQATRQSPSLKMAAALPSASQTSIQNGRPSGSAESHESMTPMESTTEEQTTYHIAPISSVDASFPPNSRPLASSNDVRFDTLDSLVQHGGRTKSSRTVKTSEDIASTSAQSGLSALEVSYASLRSTAILVAMKTLTNATTELTSVRTKNTDDEPRETPPMSTDKRTTSRVEPDAVSSSPSELQRPSSENRSGPSTSTPSVGMYVLILVVFVMSG